MSENISLAIELLNSGIYSLITVQTVPTVLQTAKFRVGTQWIRPVPYFAFSTTNSFNNVYLEPETIIVLLNKTVDWRKLYVYLRHQCITLVASLNSDCSQRLQRLKCVSAIRRLSGKDRLLSYRPPSSALGLSEYVLFRTLPSVRHHPRIDYRNVSGKDRLATAGCREKIIVNSTCDIQSIKHKQMQKKKPSITH